MRLAVVRSIPATHPRRADELRGLTSTRLLEPPDFLALNHWHSTTANLLGAYIVFGIVLGANYRPWNHRQHSQPRPDRLGLDRA